MTIASDHTNSYRQLIVWQKSVELVVHMYELTAQFPKEELYGITSQMRRAAISIPSNIAEGRYRGTRKDYVHFLRQARSSGAELETQMEIAKRLQFADPNHYKKAAGLLDEIMRMLTAMISTLSSKL